MNILSLIREHARTSGDIADQSNLSPFHFLNDAQKTTNNQIS